MKKFILFIALAISLFSCKKEEEAVIKLSDNNVFEVSLEPQTLKAGETTNLLIKIKSKEKGFPITIYACPPFNQQTFLAHDVLPGFTINNMYYYGAFKNIYLNSNDTTVAIEITPSRIYKIDEKINFCVFINGNNKLNQNYDLNLGVQYATSYFTMSYDEPKITSFDLKVSDISSSYLTVKTDDITIWSGSYSQIEYGICYSENTNPTINDNVVKASSDYVYKSAKLLNLNKDITKLKPNTTYYLRPYVNNGKLTYGNQISVKTLDVNYLNDQYLKLGVEYLADDKLTVKMNSITTNIKDSYTEYVINYTLKNNTTEKITEKNFSIFSLTGFDKNYQTGIFNDLYPGDYKTRSYTFKVMNSDKYHFVEYNTDFLVTKPTSSKLKWNLVN